MTHKILAGAALAALLTTGTLNSSHAAPSFISHLDCPIVGGTACGSATASYGTVIFTQAGLNTVDIAVLLNGGSPLSVQYIALNYDSNFSSATNFTATVTGGSFLNSPVTVGNGEFTLNGSGNYGGTFDLKIPPNGTITQAGDTFTVALTAPGLTAADLFGQTDTSGLFDFAVHLQNCGPSSGNCLPGQTGDSSIVIGELAGGTPPPPPPVPEPATLALLGVGLLGLGLARRRLS